MIITATFKSVSPEGNIVSEDISIEFNHTKYIVRKINNKK